jgi:hypothetical protein
MTPGPVPRTDATVTVSLTEFTAHRLRDLPGIARDGVAFSRAWWAMWQTDHFRTADAWAQRHERLAAAGGR